MSKTQRSSGILVSFEMIARTSWVTEPVSSHSNQSIRSKKGIGEWRELWTCERILSEDQKYEMRGATEDALFEVVLNVWILRYKDSLSILLHHMKVVRRIHLALEENPLTPSAATPNARCCTHVFTAYLKNSVTSTVEPLSVIACLFACLVAIVCREKIGRDGGGKNLNAIEPT